MTEPEQKPEELKKPKLSVMPKQETICPKSSITIRLKNVGAALNFCMCVK